MIDRTKKKAPVNAPKNFNDSSHYPTVPWKELFEDIFVPCLTTPPGNIYSKQGIQISAGRLVKMVKELSCLQLTHYETEDVKGFIDFYRAFLDNMDQGPGGPNTILSRQQKSIDPLHKVFANLGRNLMDGLEAQMIKIGEDSKQAEKLHESRNDLNLSPSIPSAKASISISDDLANTVENLHRMSKGLRVVPISKHNGLNLADQISKTPNNAVEDDHCPTIDLAS